MTAIDYNAANLAHFDHTTADIRTSKRVSVLTAEEARRISLNKSSKIPPSLKDSIRFSFHLKSPLFQHTTLGSPTFALDFSDAKRLSQKAPLAADSKTPPFPALAYAGSASGSDESSLSSTLPTGGLTSSTNPIIASSAAGKVPMHETSLIDEDNDLIDAQLEMLEQLFPKEMKSYSGSIPKDMAASVAAMMASPPPLPSSVGKTAATSNHKIDEASPVLIQLSSNATGILSTSNDLKPDAADAPGQMSGGHHNIFAETTVSTLSLSKPPDEEKRLSRPGLLGLSINTVSSQAYATKELVLIRKLKEEGRIKKDEKANKAKPAKAAEELVNVEKPVSPIKAKPNSPRFPFPEMAQSTSSVTALKRSISEKTNVAANGAAADPPAVAKTPAISATNVPTPAVNRHLRGLSTDTTNSGIVWSAVVEKFSEMAQEIAGKPGFGSTRKASIASFSMMDDSARSSTQTLMPPNRTSVNDQPRKSSLVIITPAENSTEDTDDQEDLAPIEDSMISLEKTDAQAVLGSPSRVAIPTSDVQLDIADASLAAGHDVIGDDVTRLSDDETEENEGSESDDDINSVDKPITPMKTKRRSRSLFASALRKDRTEDETPEQTARTFARKARGVRIVSKANVEGDYADFLKNSSERKNSTDQDLETASKLSKMSKGTGVENGLFRRGSMRSILTGKTIATVGGVSIKDLSRGARFRKPSPFFACGHGYRKVHGPFTPWSTPKRKPSLQRKVSGKKRGSVEVEESLLTTMARMREQQREAEKPMLGGFNFEPGADPAGLSKSSYTPSKSNVGTNLDLKRKGPASSRQEISYKPYAQTSFTPSSKPFAQSSVGPPMRSGTSVPNPSVVASPFAPMSLQGRLPGGMPMQRGQSASDIGVSTKPFAKQIPRGPSPASSVVTPSLPFGNALQAQGRGGSAVGISRPPGPASTMSLLSSSRQQILKSSQSAISVSSNHSGRERSNTTQPSSRPTIPRAGSTAPSTSRSNVSVASSGRPTAKRADTGPIPKAASSAPSQLPTMMPGRSPPSQPVPPVPMGSFISMTPARSEVSLKSSRSAEAVGSIAANVVGGPGPASYQPPRLPSKQNSSNDAVHRASTAPLPALPGQIPGSGSQIAGQRAGNQHMPNQKPNPALSVDTGHAAPVQAASQGMQPNAQHYQPVRQASAPQTNNMHHNMQRQASGQTVMSPDEMETFAPRTSQSLDTSKPLPASTPRSASSVMASVFNTGPKRPSRDTQDSLLLDPRRPRPPSVQPVADGSGGKGGKSNGLKKVFGFGKKK